MTRIFVLIGLAGALGGATACKGSSTEPVVCTAQYVYGVGVLVKDSVSLAPAAAGATLRIVDTSTGYRDSTTYSSTSGKDEWALTGAGEHPGTFTLTVSKPGYRDWVRTNVVVTKDACHVQPVEFTALLQH